MISPLLKNSPGSYTAKKAGATPPTLLRFMTEAGPEPSGRNVPERGYWRNR